MTGTPTSNGPTDAYGLAKLVNDARGESYRHFEDRTMLKVGPFKKVVRQGAREAAHKLLQPAIRFAISDCIDLPPCTIQGRDVELSAEQSKAYKALRQDAQVAMKSGKLVSAVNEGVLRLKLLQICCGAVYDGDRVVHELDCSPRLRVLEEILAEAHEKVIILAPFTSAIHLLSSKLAAYNHRVINGQVSAGQRRQIVSDFQSAHNPRVLIADPGTLAHGLTLTAAATLVWWCPTDSTEEYLQANKRIDRPGQTKVTTIVQLASTAVEKEIYRRLANNESMQGALMKMMEGVR